MTGFYGDPAKGSRTSNESPVN